jgi:hypothetical protein
VDDAVDLRVLGKDIVETGLVCDIDLEEGGASAADELDAIERDHGRIVEVIDNDDVVAVLEQRKGSEGANVARTTTSHNQYLVPPVFCCHQGFCGAGVFPLNRGDHAQKKSMRGLALPGNKHSSEGLCGCHAATCVSAVPREERCCSCRSKKSCCLWCWQGQAWPTQRSN